MISAESIHMTVNRRDILRNVNLQIQPGMFTVVVGPNGAGKSSLLKIISGETDKYLGNVMINGRALEKYNAIELSKIRAVLPQSSHLQFSFTVQQIIELGTRFHKNSSFQNRRIWNEVMELTGISSWHKRDYQTLSGGERQRVQLARVLAQIWEVKDYPRFVLLDEPSSYLDIAQQQMIFGLVKQTCDRNVGVLAILHDLNQVSQFADQLYFLKEGHIVAHGETKEVFTKSIIEETFCCRVNVYNDPCTNCPYIIPDKSYSSSLKIVNRMTPITESNTKSTSLRASWEILKKNKPALRIRDCAEELNVSEAELLASTVGDYTIALLGDWAELLSRLPELGRVMSLTRNDSCVLEHKGHFQKIDLIKGPHPMATVIGPIETRVFFSAWKFGFAVRQETPRGLQQSIQIFDEAGEAVTKIFLVESSGNKPGSNQEAFDKIVADFTARSQNQELEISEVRTTPTLPVNQVNREALLADWSNMKDTHDFFGMLRKHQVNRLDAVVLSEGMYSYSISKESLRILLEKAAQDHLPIMVFAGNRGNLQIHQGKIQTVRVMDNWLNILDPDFNMHLREDHVENIWVVKKPTTDGIVTGIEVFDKHKGMIVQFFGLRKPGIQELDKWRDLVAQLPKL
ncbi:hypothetical protein WSM22_44230 [Cytophagales bacterium WSM2-2]|nr:hypothetical protein WSM22_44230 [Cytophagales bacterium WSM2-2]